jgi:dihydroorotate dehydrogenase
MLLAGAHAVALGTALLRDPGAAGRIAGELRDELARHGVTDLTRLVGAGHPTHRGAPA